MELHGVHHVTAITGDAPGNVEFYVGVLGLRLVKKTVNQDDPTVYHLFYADEQGSPGRGPDVLRVPRRSAAGCPAPGWCTGSCGASARRPRSTSGRSGCSARASIRRARTPALRFADPEGLEHELVVYDGPDAPLVAAAPDVPREHALQGFDGVRAYAIDPARSAPLLRDVLGFAGGEDGRWEVRGRRARRVLRLGPRAADPADPGRGHRPPRRVRLAARGADGLAGARRRARAARSRRR